MHEHQTDDDEECAVAGGASEKQNGEEEEEEGKDFYFDSLENTDDDNPRAKEIPRQGRKKNVPEVISIHLNNKSR